MRLAVCLLMAALAVPVAAQAQPFDEVRDQGMLYVQRNQYKQAKVFLDRAWATPEGKADFKTAYYRGLTAHELLLLEDAFAMMALAKSLAQDDREKLRVQELQEVLDGQYGKITIKASENETNPEGRIHIESQTGIINRKKKAQFQTIRDRFRNTDISVPVSIYLPYGNYRINEVPVSLEAGKSAPEIAVILHKLGGKEDEGGVSGWVWVGAGTAAAAAGVAAILLLNDEAAPIRKTDIVLGSE